MTRFDKSLCILYAVIAIAALITTQINNIAFFQQADNGGMMGFINALYANPAAASIANDVLFYAFAGCVFMTVEARRIGVRYIWVYILLSFLVAISVTFPIFLIARQYKFAQQRI